MDTSRAPESDSPLLERLIFAVLVVVGLLGGIKALEFPQALPRGPGLIPGIACGILVAWGIAGFALTWRYNKRTEKIRWRLFARAVASVAIYISLLNVLTFLVASALGILCIYEMSQPTVRLRQVPRHWRELVVIFLVLVAIDLLFTRVLHAGLP